MRKEGEGGNGEIALQKKFLCGKSRAFTARRRDAEEMQVSAREETRNEVQALQSLPEVPK
jgi:hypothetical protein